MSALSNLFYSAQIPAAVQQAILMAPVVCQRTLLDIYVTERAKSLNCARTTGHRAKTRDGHEIAWSVKSDRFSLLN